MKTQETFRLFIFFIICFAVMALCIIGTRLDAQNIDINLLRQIHTPHDLQLDGCMRGVSNSTFIVCLAAPLAVEITGIVKQDREMCLNTLFLIGATTVTLGLTDVIKHTVKRVRPFDRYNSIENKSRQEYVQDPSFPSGHTASAFNMATYLSLSYPRWYVVVPSMTWACAVGYSRMYLGVHYPSDVLAGAVLGAGTAWLTYYLNKHCNRKFHKC